MIKGISSQEHWPHPDLRLKSNSSQSMLTTWGKCPLTFKFSHYSGAIARKGVLINFAGLQPQLY